MRFIGRRDDAASPKRLREKMDWAEARDRPQRPHHALRRLQLRRPGRDPRRRAALRRRGRGGVPPRPLRARDARPRPDHPHERRAAHVQLPALAGRLRRARVPRRAVARLLAATRSRRASQRVRAPPRAASGAGPRERAAGAPSAQPHGRGGPAQPALGPRRARARRDPGDRFAIAIVALGGWVFAAGLAVLGVVCLHELYTMLARTRPVKLAGFVGLVALLVAARPGRPRHSCSCSCAAVPLVFAPRRSLAPERRDLAPPIAVTMLGHRRGSAWRWPTPCCCATCPHGGGIVIDVLVGTFIGDTGAYLGGRALGRRPLAPRSRRTRPSRGSPIGMRRRRRRRRGSPGSTRTG